jgi:hypothetical protein
MGAENDTLVCTECGKTYSGEDMKAGDYCGAVTTFMSGSKEFTVTCAGELEEIDEDEDDDEDEDEDDEEGETDETELPCGCVIVVPPPQDAYPPFMRWCPTHKAAEHWRTVLTMIAEMTRHDGARAAALAKDALAWPGCDHGEEARS